MVIQSSQLDLFKDNGPAEPAIEYKEEFLEDHDQWFSFLLSKLTWNHQFKSRKTAMFGVSYGYKGERYRYSPLPSFLKPFCEKTNVAFGYYPNSCLVNNYPNGDHYISYHSDKDMEMNDHTGVTIVSLGVAREMGFRRIDDPSIRCFYALQPGSAVYMDDEVQQHWQHSILKQTGCGHRISLSFRSLIER